MMLLDTNVLSECMRPAPAPQVVVWLDAQTADQLWVSAISRAEIELGIALLPDGQRKDGLREAAAAMFAEDFAGRCLPFDAQAAIRYADIVARRTHAGRPITVEDAQIAAIALTHRLTLVTRNTRDFDGIEGLALVDPWQWTA
ncbi:type II toxin-antitoxin system VapC family toxin [Thermochromatium tepidum]|uniref:Ribonuclease VapC n=1 Tax=Thermochromatium tepidum ATCC 43061 TaxID=316276 RepID=A0A6I6E0Z0_THETI|nr:type II toxin-antitoxin system VapC family toxin [Thermochromatium tepidum]QGU33534.1 PIN domain-containing protein [Thermochromatium tepidum ATCC 43061]